MDRKVLRAIEQRKLEGEDLCQSCNGSGYSDVRIVCIDCLGQGVLLYEDEYRTLLEIAGHTNDDILEVEVIE